MRCLLGFMCVLALGLMGCSETAGNGGSGGDGGSAGIGGQGGEAGQGGAREAILQFLPTVSSPDGEPVPLAGVLLCEIDTTNCDVTDAGGWAELQMPADQEISFSHVKEGYGSELRSDVLVVGPNFVSPRMETDAWHEDMFARVASPYPMEGTGAISVTVAEEQIGGGPIVGATLKLLGTTGKPFYSDDVGDWSPALTATTMGGPGGFVEVTPGEVEVEVGGTAQNCTVERGWPGNAENTIRMLVREGFVTSPRVACEDQSE